MRLAYAHCFIGKLYMQAVFIGSRVNGNCFYAHFSAGADYPQCYFAPVGNKYFFKHEKVIENEQLKMKNAALFAAFLHATFYIPN